MDLWFPNTPTPVLLVGARAVGLLGDVIPKTDCQALSPEILIQEELVDSWNPYFKNAASGYPERWPN